MSSKTKASVSKEEARPVLVPKLRFPEFRETRGWESGKVDDLVDTVTPPKKLPTAIYASSGAFPIIDQSQSEICGWTDDNEALIQECLPLIVFGDHTCILKLIDRPFAQGADGIKILKSRSKVGTPFLFQFLSHRPVVTEEYKRHYSILKEKTVFFPEFKSGEQKKIAECLSSVDELIAAQARKVNALKTHKKGLMQQVFPREGETQPRLRFPEFQNSREWEAVPLGDIAEIKLGKMLDKQKHTSGRLLPYLNNLAVRWNEINTSDLPKMYFNDSELDRFGLRAGDVVVCEGGEPGRAAVWDGRMPDLKFQKAIHRVRFNVPFDPKILALHLENLAGTTQFEMLFTGGGIKHLTGETFSRLKIPLIPHAEQQRIASCLSSLDALITLETQKLEALKTHKKGLMQQIFPVMDAKD